MRKTVPIFLLIMLLLPAGGHAALPGFMLKKAGTMSGQVFIDDQPLANGIVSFFLASGGLPPSGNGMARVPEFLARSDAEGRFSAKLPGGEYYMGMLLREVAAGPGPPRPGEKYYFAAQPDGGLRRLVIADKEILSLGRIDGKPPESFSAGRGLTPLGPEP